MPKKIRVYSVWDFEQYISNSSKIEEVNYFVAIAIGQYNQKKLNQLELACLLSKASSKILTF